MTERIDGRLAALETAVEKVWSQRRIDKREAKVDAEQRHKELMAAIKNVNGTVRDHGERIVAVETQCRLHHRGGSAPLGDLLPDGGDAIEKADNRKLAAQVGGYAGGTVAALWIVYQLVVRVIEAIQAAQAAGAGGV